MSLSYISDALQSDLTFSSLRMLQKITCSMDQVLNMMAKVLCIKQVLLRV